MPPPLSPLQRLDNLPNVPHFDAHAWVDYIELLCLVNIDRSISMNDVLDRVREFDTDLPEGDNSDDEEGEDVEVVPKDLSPAEANDEWSMRADDWFRHLSYRSGSFGNAYPFILSGGSDSLQIKADVTPEQELYIFLLLCANLRYCQSSTSALTRTFEQLSVDVMRSYFSGAEVHVFGTSEIAGGKYTGSLYEKVRKLAADLGEEPKIKEGDLPVNAAGDGGLDIVAWVPMGDDNPHRIVLFGQCACTEKWDVKQFSSSIQRWTQFMSISAGAGNVIFIPHCLRRTDGSWHRPTDIASIMVDRSRFLFSLQNRVTMFQSSPARLIVQNALSQRENVF